MTISLIIDEQTEETLKHLGASEGAEVADVAARLLTSAVRRERTRGTLDQEALKARYAEFAAEDAALADSACEERLQLLECEDRS